MDGKRGRPKENGKPGRELYRAAEVLYAYNNCKQAGVKHKDALEETAKAVRAKISGVRISATAIRRILSEFQGEGSTSLIVTAPNAIESEEIRTLPGGKRVKKGLEFTLGEHPHLPRSNAKDSAVLQKKL